MALWYCGSVQYAAVAQYANLTPYLLGDIVRQLAAPAVGSERCFRCTTPGTSGAAEPTWILTKGATTNAGTAVFTEVTGNATYNWAAPFARISTATNSTSWLAAGDTLYVAHNHTATQSTLTAYATACNGTSALPVKVICVNAAGSVPPVAADEAFTATEFTTGSSNMSWELTDRFMYLQGIAFTAGNAANTGIISLHNNSGSAGGLKAYRCAFVLGGSGSSALITANPNNSDGIVELDNCTVSFSNVAQTMGIGGTFIWKNTASAIVGATIPAILFTGHAGRGQTQALISGVDLSAAGSGKTLVAAWAHAGAINFVNCKLGASVTQAVVPGRLGFSANFINCNSGTVNYYQSSQQFAGALTPETTIVRTGGASDGTTPLSWKIVSNADAQILNAFQSFPIVIWNTAVGSPLTATVEILNDGLTLTDANIWMVVESLDTSGFPISTFHSTGLPSILSTATNIPTSSVTWTTTGIGSPVKQYLQTTFTPQMVGLVRATVYLARPSTTVYVDPKITLA